MSKKEWPDDADDPCLVCDESQIHRRLMGRNLCRNHFEELMETKPEFIQEWMDDHAAKTETEQ